MKDLIRFEYRNCMVDRVGLHGITEKEISAMKASVMLAHDMIKEKEKAGRLGFMALPYMTQEAGNIQAYADKKRSGFENLVVIGIGGSALGNIALQGALRHPFWNLLSKKGRRGGLRLFVPDNVDPVLIRGLLDAIDVRKTLFNVISKSGTTAECLANYFILKKELIRRTGKRYKEHIIVTTDEKKGYLRESVEKEGFASFSIPANVGGRFSVLSPVGLVSAAFTGIDIKKLLSGAASMAQVCRTGDLSRNPAYLYAAIQYLFYNKGKMMNVVMPYSSSLEKIADWFRQLWAESLGKKNNLNHKVVNVGPTPIKALGVTDQHSQLQLYIEGPYDKVITFLSVKEPGQKIDIPVFDRHYLGGKELWQLLKYEEHATRAALTKNSRPNCRIELSVVDEHTIGQLFYFFELATACAGELFQIDAFDQPGVEQGKILTYGLMGRKGYGKERREIQEFLRNEKKDRHIV